MTIKEQAIRAAADALTQSLYPHRDAVIDDAIAALEAAMPHIREQVAQEIEARVPTLSDKPIKTTEDAMGAAVSAAIHEGMKLSARIVRKNP